MLWASFVHFSYIQLFYLHYFTWIIVFSHSSVILSFLLHILLKGTNIFLRFLFLMSNYKHNMSLGLLILKENNARSTAFETAVLFTLSTLKLLPTEEYLTCLLFLLLLEFIQWKIFFTRNITIKLYICDIKYIPKTCEMYIT